MTTMERTTTGASGASGAHAVRATALALLATACGGGGAAVAAVSNAGGGGGDDPLVLASAAPGGAGFPGVAWGATVEDVQRAHPGARADDGGLVLPVRLVDETCEARLGFETGRLVQVVVRCARAYASMDACVEPFRAARAELDRVLGASAEENLAAFWTLDGTAATLACSPDEDGPATMGMSYLPTSD